MSELNLSPREIDYLLTPKAIRDRAESIFEFTKTGHGAFQIHEERFDPMVDYVMKVIAKNYPSGEIPFHSRWGHFRAGGVDRAALLKTKLGKMDVLERARTELDLDHVRVARCRGGRGVEIQG